MRPRNNLLKIIVISVANYPNYMRCDTIKEYKKIQFGFEKNMLIFLQIRPGRTTKNITTIFDLTATSVIPIITVRDGPSCTEPEFDERDISETHE